MDGEKLVAVVTGAGSGIGYETAKLLLEKGWEVWDLSRRDRAHAGVKHMSCDIANEDRVITAINLIYSQCGHIDLLVNNAGFGISGAVEFTASEDAHRLMEVNLFGMASISGFTTKSYFLRSNLPSVKTRGFLDRPLIASITVSWFLSYL